jgi:hypothetical protein
MSPVLKSQNQANSKPQRDTREGKARELNTRHPHIHEICFKPIENSRKTLDLEEGNRGKRRADLEMIESHSN